MMKRKDNFHNAMSTIETLQFRLKGEIDPFDILRELRKREIEQ